MTPFRPSALSVRRAIDRLALTIGLATLAACAPIPLGGAGPSGLPGAGGAPIRIGLLQGVRVATVECSETMRVSAGAGTLHGKRFVLRAGSGRISISGSGGDGRGTKVTCEAASPIKVDGTAYRGAVEVSLRSGAMTVVNIVGLEDYVSGVVPKEIGYLKSEEVEAMKAQALAARTYTVAHLGRRASSGFDLYSDTRDQVYGGVSVESDVGNRAVRETAGLVMTHNGRPIQAFFHSTCGGSTANIEDVWESEPVPYLRRTYDADADGEFNCRGSRHFRWTETYSAAAAREMISSNLRREVPGAPRDVGRIREVVVDAQALSGRAQSVRVTSDNGTWVVRKKKIRAVLRRRSDGEDRPLRSTYIRILNDRTPDGYLSRVVISGAGNGHGIGMCQWGAIGMARAGRSAEQIVRKYYRGTELSLYNGGNMASVANLEGSR